jgi:hypothetical protein
VTEHRQNPEGHASESPSGDDESTLPATEVHAPGPGEVPPDTEVNPAEPDAAPTMVDAPAPMLESDTAPTVIAPTPSAAAEAPPEPEPAPEAAGEAPSEAAAEAPSEPEPEPEAAPETAPAVTAAAEAAPAAAPAPGTKPATPPPEPPPPEPPPIALDSDHGTSAADRPEIPVAAAFVGGFVLAMILRRLARSR